LQLPKYSRNFRHFNLKNPATSDIFHGFYNQLQSEDFPTMKSLPPPMIFTAAQADRRVPVAVGANPLPSFFAVRRRLIEWRWR